MSYDTLIERAREAMENAHAPYSNFKVGAAVLTSRGDIFVGCNVENASYSLTSCAERTAIVSGIAAVGADFGEIEAVVIVNNSPVQVPPCGACRQVIAEFGPKATVVLAATESEAQKEWQIEEILPFAFTPGDLLR